MPAAFSKAEIKSEITNRFVDAFKLQEKVAPITLSTGISSLDDSVGGVPRGAISEIFGRTSSGRTSLMLSVLAYATTHDEICAVVDTSNAFAPTSAAVAGINFDRLLWIRCGGNLEHAFKATDLLLHAGGFGLVVLDLGDVAGTDARRIISSWWYRFRRSVESKPTAIIVISEEACTRSCSTLTLELNSVAEWSGTNRLQSLEDQTGKSSKGTVLPIRTQIFSANSPVTHGNLLRLNSIKINRRRPLISSWNEVQFNALNSF